MADDEITVDFATLQELSGDLEDILKRLNDQLDLLYRRAEKVVLTWEGRSPRGVHRQVGRVGPVRG